MKKFLSLLVSFILVVTLAKAQYVTIPDATFRAYLQFQFSTCFNVSGMMDTTCSDIINAKSLSLGGQLIANLEGIQYFKSLTYLDCSTTGISSLSLSLLPNSLLKLACNTDALSSLPALPNGLNSLECTGNFLNSLPALPNSLTYLDCSSNQISSLPAPLPTSLTVLNCSGNQITGNLPALPSSLTVLNCSQNQFTGTIPILPSTLTTLNCSQNQFTGTIPILPNTLDTFNCSGNQFTGAIPALPNTLTTLNCSGNQFTGTTLPVLPNSLISLTCESNHLTSLPSLPASLTDLDCSYNQLKSLPDLPASLIGLGCRYDLLTNLPTLPHTLGSLYCANNFITSLPTLPDTLSSLYCFSNLINSLPALPRNLNVLGCDSNNIYCLPVLPNGLMMLVFDDSKIHCIPNKPASLTLFNNIPLCNPTNNINHCPSFPVMAGTVFYDNNSNGIKDAGELYRPYVELQLSDGSYTFTNTNGYYEIAAIDGLSSYTLAAYAPTYYKAVPVLMNYTFTSFDTLVTQSIALQPTAFVDSLSLTIYSYAFHARPGFDFPVIVNYADVGTTTLSPTVTLNYDNTLLTYDSSSNHNVINNGSSLSLSESDFVPGQSGSFIAYFNAKTNDVLGDSVKTKASIAGNAFSVSDSIANLISGSQDPNDKEATPQLTPEQVQKGKSIQYTIRFQNTGTDTAFNIVIADTLSGLLQTNTLQVISTSKPCKVTVDSNIVYFEFLNILLPDSATNEIGSNGYVSFSVQPQTSVSNGSIPNTAFIYFDYNTPVVTNTATTLIQDGTVPLRLLSFTALIQPGTTNALLYWNTASEINTKSFIIEQSTDGISFNDIATVNAKGFGGHSYSSAVADNYSIVYYRLKIIDNDGSYNYSPIVKLKASQAKGFIVLNNPVKDIITIKTNDESLNNTAATIINSAGIVVKRFVMHTSTQTIDVSSLPAGGYYLQTQSNSLKVIIAK
jgi:uncharacterized repeat protein (TIGR01451 family)